MLRFNFRPEVSQEHAAQGSPVDLSWLRAHSDDGLQGLGENKGAFYPPTADGADWDCGDPSEGHSCDISGANHGIHDWGTVDDGNRMAFACNSAGETRGNRGSQGDAAACNNGVPPPVSTIALSDCADACTKPANLESICNRTAPHATAPCTPEEAGTRELCVGQGRNQAWLRRRLWPNVFIVTTLQLHRRLFPFTILG